MNDPRETFANESVAHITLKGQVDALRFSEGTKKRVASATANVFKHPDSIALERQALFGETVVVLETKGARSFGRIEQSGYVGYFYADNLGPWHEATHFVSARTTVAFSKPDIKSPAPLALALGSQIACIGEAKGFARTIDGKYIPQSHLRTLETPFGDAVAVAREHIGTPYLWGGNSTFGIDCSGLIQMARHVCGLACPGDSDQQAGLSGQELSDAETLRAGDLLFWKGHVAMASGPESIIHANAHHMAVVEEALAPAIKRIADSDTGPLMLRLRPD